MHQIDLSDSLDNYVRVSLCTCVCIPFFVQEAKGESSKISAAVPKKAAKKAAPKKPAASGEKEAAITNSQGDMQVRFNETEISAKFLPMYS